ncbi:TraR/DksA family transcriptional regulator [Thermodesulfobacteriota bacterium]
METADLDYFRELLTAQLEGLLNQARGTANDLINDEDSRFTEFVDMASFDENQNQRLKIRNRESNLIKKNQTALWRIEEGEFGICEDCGKEIPFNRLMARLITTKCIRCKTREELAERAIGF